MNTATFVKHYTHPTRAAAAARHLRWLTQVADGIRFPHLYQAAGRRLVLERLPGHQPTPDDLQPVADVLGRLHGTAYAKELHAARLDQPFTTATGLAIPSFHTGRQAVLAHFPTETTGLPAALYKDANLRNFLITPTSTAIVDFDDLTLAPFGHDLAKLIVSMAMTHGRLDADQIHAALHTYNAATADACGRPDTCSTDQLATYTEMHHLLTARYLHHNGYQHPWPTVRPSPQALG